MILHLLFALCLGLLASAIYWLGVTRLNGVSWSWFGRSRNEWRLRQGGNGYARLLAGWLLVLVIYALCLEAVHAPFTASWWSQAITADEWFLIGIGACILAWAEWHFLAKPQSVDNLPLVQEQRALANR